jgi:hypothetical protein
LDSIAARVGPRPLWEYVKHKIEVLQKEKGFDYTNIVTRPKPEELYPEVFHMLISKLDDYLEKVGEDRWQPIEKELSQSKQLISIKERKRENLDVLLNKVAGDKTMQERIVPTINKLVNELSDLLD